MGHRPCESAFSQVPVGCQTAAGRLSNSCRSAVKQLAVGGAQTLLHITQLLRTTHPALLQPTPRAHPPAHAHVHASAHLPTHTQEPELRAVLYETFSTLTSECTLPCAGSVAFPTFPRVLCTRLPGAGPKYPSVYRGEPHLDTGFSSLVSPVTPSEEKS